MCIKTQHCVVCQVKVESTGLPRDYRGSVADFCAEYMEREGITIDPENLRPNPSLRFVAKVRLTKYVTITV